MSGTKRRNDLHHPGSGGGEPSVWTKLLRRITVFRVAAQVWFDYQWASRVANRKKKRLGFRADDDAGDDHPMLQEYWSQVHGRNACLLLAHIQRLEGFWVKVGQYLSSRADILPPEYLQTLAELQDSMPPRSWEETARTIREELFDSEAAALSPNEKADTDEWWSEHFVNIDHTPLSTASLAQVHRATLKLPPKECAVDSHDVDGSSSCRTHDVVIKVQHRGVASLMLQDMENLKVILNLLAKTDPDLDFGPVIREYSTEVKKELDFRTEAVNMNDVRELLARSNSVQAIVPKTIPGLVTERVLVMDFCEGFPIRDTAKLDLYRVDRELLLERVCTAWAIQMHVGGIFNADPHMGNILVSTAIPGDASVPVLLDFGLTKRLDPKIKLAFARLMHSSHESDVDGLLQSFDEMGLKMNRYDPFEDMANMQRGFGNTVPQSEVRQVSKRKNQEYKQRTEAKRTEAGLKKGQKLRSPVDSWPSELIFFGRVTAMLRGMCSRLDVSYPYLRTMSMAARGTICASVPTGEHATAVVHPSADLVATPLQKRLIHAIEKLSDENQMVGLQICVLKKGKPIANIAAGTLSSSNPRPVTPGTLFNVFSVSKGVLTIGLLRLIQDGCIENLDDPVAKYWPAFASKPTVTVRHILTHQTGLANVYPEDANLDTLLDWSAMTSFVAKEAVPGHDPGAERQYHALSYAWLVGGLIESVTGRPYEEWFDEILPVDEGVRKNLFLAGISDAVDDQRDLAVLSVDRRQAEMNGAAQPSTRNDSKAASTAKDDETKDEDEEEQKKRTRKLLTKYQGLQQLMNPTVFNMQKVRRAKLPSANGHASAEALARIFDAVIRGSDDGDVPLLSTETLELARVPSNPPMSNGESMSGQAMLNDSLAKFGLGFQLHDFVLSNGARAVSIGHGGLGGSVVLAVPEEEVVLAFTLNQLSNESLARKTILGIVFDDLGWIAPSSLPVECQRGVAATVAAAGESR